MNVNASAFSEKKPEGDVIQRSRQDWGTLIELIGQARALDDINIHGLMYLLKEGLGIPLSYTFKMRLSGPYSGELLEDVQRLEGHRLLVRLNGKYSLGDAPELGGFQDGYSTQAKEVVGHLFDVIATVAPDRVAVLPTLLLALRESSESDHGRLTESVVQFVSSLRPAMSHEDVMGAFTSLPTLVSD